MQLTWFGSSFNVMFSTQQLFTSVTCTLKALPSVIRLGCNLPVCKGINLGCWISGFGGLPLGTDGNLGSLCMHM